MKKSLNLAILFSFIVLMITSCGPYRVGYQNRKADQEQEKRERQDESEIKIDSVGAEALNQQIFGSAKPSQKTLPVAFINNKYSKNMIEFQVYRGLIKASPYSPRGYKIIKHTRLTTVLVDETGLSEYTAKTLELSVGAYVVDVILDRYRHDNFLKSYRVVVTDFAKLPQSFKGTGPFYEIFKT